MARVRRIDIGTLKSPVYRPDGTMVAEARLTRTGVFTYRNADGTERKEYRPDTSVFDDKSLASFRLVPLTNDHPPEMINAENARKYNVGAVGQDVRRDGNTMVATIAVHDASTIRDMKAGKTQVSNGYECDLVESPGMSPDGERYDCIQTNIVGNHLAIVGSARAGKDAAVRMDAAYAIDTDDNAPTRKDSFMDLAQALAALQAANEKAGAEKARADAAEKDRDAHKTASEALTATNAELKTRCDTAEKARKDALDATPARVKARVALEASAVKVLPRTDNADADVSGLDDKALRLAVIKHVSNVDCSDKSDAYIEARYDACIERAAASADTFRSANEHIERAREDASSDHAGDKARAANQTAKRFIAPGTRLSVKE